MWQLCHRNIEMVKVEISLLSELQFKHHMTTAGGVGGGGAEIGGLLSE